MKWINRLALTTGIAGVLATSIFANEDIGPDPSEVARKNLTDQDTKLAEKTYFWGSNKIPESLDYWDFIFKWYESRGMSRKEFERIREKKREYRERPECQDWPYLKPTNPVPVSNDKDEWEKENSTSFTGAHYDREDNKIRIDPDAESDDREKEQAVSHEGMHSAQDHKKLPDNDAVDVVWDMGSSFDADRLYWDYRRKRESIYYGFETDKDRYYSVLGKMEDEIIEGSSGDFHSKYRDLVSGYDDIISEPLRIIRYENSGLRELFDEVTEDIEPENKKRAEEYLGKAEEILRKEATKINERLKEARREYERDLAGVYTGSTTELDPRLAEVGRYWFETEGKAVLDQKTAKKALDRFMYGDVPAYHNDTQRDLIGVKEHYEREDKWDKVREEMVERIPGLM